MEALVPGGSNAGPGRPVATGGRERFRGETHPVPNAVDQLVDDYIAALQEYLAHREESALTRAYELGRRALAGGIGVLEMIELQHRTLASVLLDKHTPEETAEAIAASTDLFSESLVPFEMTYRGFRESVRKLAQLSETLEQQVTERTAELRQMKEKYYGIFESAIEGIFQSTLEGRYLTVNPALAHKLGYETPQELIHAISDIGRQLYVEPSRREQFSRVMEEHGYVWEFESQVYRKDGRIIWISENARTVRDASGGRYYQGFVIDITDRKRSEETRARLAAIVESSDDAIVGSALDGTVTSWNQGAERIFGYTAEEIVGQPIALLIPPDRLPEESVIMERLKRGEGIQNYETIRRLKDGRNIDVSLTISPIMDEAGRIIGASKIIRDISERKRAEEVLQARAWQQSVISELSQEALANVDLAILMHEATARVARTLGVEYGLIVEREADGTGMLRAGTGWMVGHVGQAVAGTGADLRDWVTLLSDGPVVVEALATETRFEPLAILRDHGVTSGVSVLIHGYHGLPFGILGAYATAPRTFTQDQLNFLHSVANILAMAIQRKRAEQALRVSEERYHSLVDGIQDYEVFMLDATGRVASWNTGAERAKGYRAEEIIGEHFSRFYPVEEIERGTPDTDLQTATVEGRYEDEGWRVRKDGSRFWADVVIAPLRDEPGHLRGFSVVVRDVTERKLGEQQLRESREQLHALSAHLLSVREEERTSIAREIHDEFGQALTGLKMDLAWLTARLAPGQQASIDKAKTMAKLIDTTVQSVRRVSMKLRPGLLDDLGILAALEWYAHDFQTRTSIQCHFTTRLPELNLDKDRTTTVFRIFQESLTNVARHANATKVTAKLGLSAGALVLEVKDNGRGITEREMANPKSFGLMGIRERAYLVGGEVQIKGRPGKGTTISVRIPLESSEPS